MDPDVASFADLFQRFLRSMAEMSGNGGPSPLKQALDSHLGVDCASVPVISDSFASYDHANVQVAMTAWLGDAGRSYELAGLAGQQRHFGSLSDLVEMGELAHVRLASVDLVNLPVGPDDTLAAVQFGIFLIQDHGVPIVVLFRGPDPRHGPDENVGLEVICAEQARARSMLGDLRRLMVQLNVFRGQVLSFGQPRMGFVGAGPVMFHRRPAVAREELVLADGVLEAIEKQVVGIATYRDRLRASGQHVKRGLLLHGPPGNGKTLIVRHLLSRLDSHTVVLLTGWGLHMVAPACGLARTLQPSVVVLEDVDLVAQERGMSPYSDSVLFELLNEMDGIEEDADVCFVLTTNRADLLEPALAARPGRVDLALEVAAPDAAALGRLIRLFGRGLDLRLEDADAVVARMTGVPASLVKELMRKAAVNAAHEVDGEGRITVTDRHMNAALDELLEEGGTLARALMGAATGEEGQPPLGGSVGPGRGPFPPAAAWAVSVGRRRLR